FITLSAEVKALSTKYKGLHLDSSVASVSPVSSAYSIKPSDSVEIPYPAAAEDFTKNVFEFIHDP
ncbi:unnamed protein product, partial [Hymenolepis diminuta]